MTKMRVVSKNHWFWKALGWIMGRLGNKTFCTTYATTIGPIVAVPDGWMTRLDEHKSTMIHERRHVTQYEWCGLGNAWIGIIPMSILLVLPLPMGFAWGRWLIERDATVVAMRWWCNHYYIKGKGETWTRLKMRAKAKRSAEKLTSGDYAWTFPPFRFVKKYMANWLFDRVTSDIGAQY